MSNRIIRIAVDAMGGDDYPDVLVEGSLAALRLFPDVEITLVGDKNSVRVSLECVSEDEESRKSKSSRSSSVMPRLRIVHADEVIEMDESPVRSIRSKKRSSIVIANRLCRSREVDAVISAGNTGAAMTASLLYMGRLAGVSRPAIMALFPSLKNIVAILDVGANANCKAEHLFQFGIMASIYMTHVLGYANPRIGLLSIGEERSKGNELTEAAFGFFEKSDLNFVGNIEGRDIFSGDIDVVVCDGFVGNILLKFSESIFGFFTATLKRHVSKTIWRTIGAYLVKPAFKDLRVDMSAEEYGGAPLLGVDGISIICHGNSSPVAIKNAIKVARQLVLGEVNDRIKRELAQKYSNGNTQ